MKTASLRLATSLAGLSLGLVLAASCGSEAQGSPQGTADGTARAEADPVPGKATPAKASAAARASDQEPVVLPSHRKLRAFLPETLPGHEITHLESDHQVHAGRAVARGRYQASMTEFREAIELEISYSAKERLNPYERLFQAGLGKRTKIAGYEAVRDESEFRGEARQEVYLRVSPQVWIQADGPGTFEELRDALTAIDLDALSEAAADGSLFEESQADRIARTLLDSEALAGLLPERIGPLEARSGGGGEYHESEPMHCRATAFYGSGNLTLYDYADAQVAAGVDLAASKVEELRRMMGRREDLVQQAPLEVQGGEGTWVVMSPGQGQPPYLVLHMVRGRLVAEYAGSFVEPAAIDESMPAAVLEQLRAAQERSGAGAFPTVEAQRDAVLAAFEAIDPDHLSN